MSLEEFTCYLSGRELNADSQSVFLNILWFDSFLMLDPLVSSYGHLYSVSGKPRTDPAGIAELHGIVASGCHKSTLGQRGGVPEIHGDI